MNSINSQSKHLRGPVLAICTSALMIPHAAAADESKVFQALLHETEVYGSEDIAEGRYDRGIERLSVRADNDRAPHSTRVPALIDLCAAYTMTRQFDKAEQACNEAVDSGWYSGHAYNNRGTYNIAVGDYEAAIRDFRAAIDERGADRIARQNLDYAEQRLIAMRESLDDVQVVAGNRGAGVEEDVDVDVLAE